MLAPKAVASASKPKWVPASITEENVAAFVQAVTEARKANESVVEFNGKKYGIKSIKEDASAEDQGLAKKIQDVGTEDAPKQASDEVPAEVKEEDAEEIKGDNHDEKEADADEMPKLDDPKVEEELSGNQHKLDLNKNGKVDGDDLKKLRTMKNESTESLLESMDKMSKPDLWVAHANHKMDSDPEISMDRENVHHHAKAAAAIESHVATKFGDQHATAMKSHTDLIHGVKTQMNSPESDKEDLRDAKKLRKQHGASHDAFNHLGESADVDSEEKPANHAEPDADDMGGESDNDADNKDEDEDKVNEERDWSGHEPINWVKHPNNGTLHLPHDVKSKLHGHVYPKGTNQDDWRADHPTNPKEHPAAVARVKAKGRTYGSPMNGMDTYNESTQLTGEQVMASLAAAYVKMNEGAPADAEAGPEVMDPATQKMKDDSDDETEIVDLLPTAAQDGADKLDAAEKPAPANKSEALPKVAIVDAPTKLGESVEVNEGAYVGGPEHAQAQWTGGINSKKSNEIRKHLIDKGHSFSDHSHVAANKQSNTHYISMNSKEGHEELQKIKKKHGLGHYPYGTPGHLSSQDHKGKAEKEDLPTHVKHDHSASYM